MANKPCTNSELIARVVAVETGLAALRQVLDERDERYKQRAASQDSAVKSAMETSEKAISKAEAATERRLEGLNELRDMATDQAKTFSRRDEVALQIKGLETKVGALDELMKTKTARNVGMVEAWGYMIGIAGLVLAAAAVYFHNGH